MKRKGLRTNRRAHRYRVRVYSEYTGWMLKEPKTVMIKGSCCSDERHVLSPADGAPRALFMVDGRPEFIFPVFEPMIQPDGIKAKWLYLWEEADIAGVALMMGDEEARTITPVPVSALQEV